MAEILDVKGLLCPLPVLKARKRLQALGTGDQLTLIATDPAAAIDVPHFCNESGNRLVSQQAEDDVLTFVIEKA